MEKEDGTPATLEEVMSNFQAQFQRLLDATQSECDEVRQEHLKLQESLEGTFSTCSEQKAGFESELSRIQSEISSFMSRLPKLVFGKQPGPDAVTGLQRSTAGMTGSQLQER